MPLTADQQAVLRDEIASDPKSRGYAQHLPASPGIVAQLLLELSDAMPKVIHSSTAQAWAATGPMASIVDVGAKPDHPCRASCLLVQTTLASGSDIHMERSDVQGMFAGWLGQKVITQAQ